MSAGSYLLTIPVEILEYVLTLLAADGEPRAIAELAATCRELHSLVYGSSSSHLWRAIYLTTFDDPRPARRIVYGRVYTIPLNNMLHIDDIYPQKKSPLSGAQSIDVASGQRDTSARSQSTPNSLRISSLAERAS